MKLPSRRRKRLLTFGSPPSGAALAGQTTRTSRSASCKGGSSQSGTTSSYPASSSEEFDANLTFDTHLVARLLDADRRKTVPPIVGPDAGGGPPCRSVIPDTAQEVVAVGPGVRSEDGQLHPLDVKTGDRVLFGSRVRASWEVVPPASVGPLVFG